MYFPNCFQSITQDVNAFTSLPKIFEYEYTKSRLFASAKATPRIDFYGESSNSDSPV